MPDAVVPATKQVALVRIVVSILVLFVALAVITAPNFAFGTPFDEGVQKIAAGFIGAVIGYWLA